MLEKQNKNRVNRSYVGSQVKMDGVLRFSGTMHLDGTYIGKIDSSESSLVIGESGEVKADIHAGDVQNYGHIVGNIVATERICLRSSSQVEGDVETSKLHIEDGAEFLGNCRMGISPRGEKRKNKKSESIQHAQEAVVGEENSLNTFILKFAIALILLGGGGYFAYSFTAGKGGALSLFQEEDTATLLNEGEQAVARGDLIRAKESFKAVLQKEPKNIKAQKALITIAKREKRYDDADSALVRLIEEVDDGIIGRDENKEMLYNDLISLRKEEGDKNKLLEAYAMKAQAFKKDTDVRKEYAQALEESGNREKALQVYQEIIALIPSDIPILKKILSYYRGKKAYGNVIDVLNRIVQFDDQHIDNYLLLGRYYNIYGLEDKANEAFERVEELDPDNIEAKNNEGFRLYQEMHYSKSRKVFRYVVGVNKKNFRAHLGLATNYMKIGSFNHAVEECKIALKLEPESAIALNRMAWSLAQLNKDLNKAMEFSQKALAINKDIPGHIDTASEIYYRMGQFEKAVETSKRAVELSPENLYYKSQLEKFEAALKKNKKGAA